MLPNGRRSLKFRDCQLQRLSSVEILCTVCAACATLAGVPTPITKCAKCWHQVRIQPLRNRFSARTYAARLLRAKSRYTSVAMIMPTQPNFNVVSTTDYRETYANSVQV